jgi:hypothetical protein
VSLEPVTWSSGWLGCFCGRPERARVYAVGMQREHRLVQLHRRRRPLTGSEEVAEIAARVLDVARRAVGIEHAMTGDPAASASGHIEEIKSQKLSIHGHALRRSYSVFGRMAGVRTRS